MREFLEWQEFPALEQPVQGAFVGVSNEALIVAGGTCFSGASAQPSDQIWLDTISVLEKDWNAWQSGFKLNHPRAYGASVSTEKGMILIGGCDADRCHSSVIRLNWNKAEKNIDLEFLPDLPQPCAYATAALVDKTIYLVGGMDSPQAETARKNFWALDLSLPEGKLKWKTLTAWPEGPGRILPVAIGQLSEENNSFYLMGGSGLLPDNNGKIIRRHLNDAYRYDPFIKDENNRWRKVLDVPLPISGVPAGTMGPSHILVFGTGETDNQTGLDNQGDILAYHTITNTWVKAGQLPEGVIAGSGVKWHDKITIISKEVAAKDNHIKVFSVTPGDIQTEFGYINYIALCAYLLVMVWMGFYFSRREKSTDDYFLAGKRIPWWAAGLSIYATTFSAISYIGTPAKVYATNWIYFTLSLLAIPIYLFIIYCLTLGLAFYAFLYFLFSQFNKPIASWFTDKIPVKTIGIYLIILAGLFYLLWLSEIIPANLSNTTPSTITESGLIINPVHVLDLSVVLPGLMIVAILLLKRKPLGLLLVPAALTFGILMDITIGSLVIVMNIKGMETDLSLAVIMGCMALFTLGLLIWYLKCLLLKKTGI